MSLISVRLTAVLDDLRAGWAERAARRHLRRLYEHIGRPGLRAAAAEPALAAAIDQHAAAVRDIVCEGSPTRCANLQTPATLSGLSTLHTPAPVSGGCVRLAAYARSLLDEHRCSEPGQSVTWHPRDWTSLRLIAVCLLAESLCER